MRNWEKQWRVKIKSVNSYIRNGRNYTPLTIKSLPEQYCYLEQPSRLSRMPPCRSPGAAAPGRESGGAVTWAADRSPPPARRTTAVGCARPPPPPPPDTCSRALPSTTAAGIKAQLVWALSQLSASSVCAKQDFNSPTGSFCTHTI